MQDILPSMNPQSGVGMQCVYSGMEQGQHEGKSDRFIRSRRVQKHGNKMEEYESKSAKAGDADRLSVAEVFRRCVVEKENQPVAKESASTFCKEEGVEDELNGAIVEMVKERRRIPKVPYKVLDAPALQDDFYLNLIDWSTQNYLAVGLSSNVYLWSGETSKVTKLCDLGPTDTVTSVAWPVRGNTFALGTNSGEVHLWDVEKLKKTKVLYGHQKRVGAIAWSSSILSTGSRDKTILQRDIRCAKYTIGKLQGHKQEVCGLKWSPDEQQLCSGGNDNKLYIWNARSANPVVKYSDHTAAVKAVAWSPHQHGLLASGGGTADKHIRFRNTLTGTTLHSYDTGSQVCNLIFGRTLNEVISTHGFSNHEINIWKYPTMEKVSTLTGHSMRVLYLAMSPDGSTIVTGTGDETLRFWKVFPSRHQHTPKLKSLLNTDILTLR